MGARGVGELHDRGKGREGNVGTEPNNWHKPAEFSGLGPHPDDPCMEQGSERKKWGKSPMMRLRGLSRQRLDRIRPLPSDLLPASCSAKSGHTASPGCARTGADAPRLPGNNREILAPLYVGIPGLSEQTGAARPSELFGLTKYAEKP